MNLDPSMMNMMKDLDGAEMNKQLESLGLSPSEVINKIMAEPDLAAAFQKPKVMQVSGQNTWVFERTGACAALEVHRATPRMPSAAFPWM